MGNGFHWFGKMNLEFLEQHLAMMRSYIPWVLSNVALMIIDKTYHSLKPSLKNPLPYRGQERKQRASARTVYA